MKSVRWDRADAIAMVRDDVWRYLTKAARTDDEVLLDAASLLQMPTRDVRTLAGLHFVLSEEVGDFLRSLPGLMRRLTTTTIRESEMSAERIRGAILWGETYGVRAATGLQHAYVTAPAQRAFDTPENRVLVAVLSKIVEFGRRTGWHRASSEGAGAVVRDRVASATLWLASRALTDISSTAVTAATIARVRSGRRRRDYKNVLSAYDLYQRYVSRLDRSAVRDAIENHALITSRDPVLLELLCAFQVVRALEHQGWKGSDKALLRPPLLYAAGNGTSTIRVYYQHAPAELTAGSLYRDVQRAHFFPTTGGLIPDLVLRYADATSVRWVLIEVKGVERRIEESARAATRDLLSYRRALSPVLDLQAGPYGIGVAWGEHLEPAATDEIVLCSPDRLASALALVG